MNKKKKMDQFLSYAIPIALGALLTWYSVRLSNKFQKQTGDNQEAIKSVADDISRIVDEIKIKNEQIDSNTLENIKVSKQLGEILQKVNNLAEKTNLIAQDIKNEQKVKGTLSLKLPNKTVYRIELGGAGNNFYYSREKLLTEDGFNAILDKENKVILNLKLRNDELLISIKLYDFFGNIISEINENDWAVGSNIFSKNWNDEALEIIDIRGNVAFQISLKDNRIIIRGILPLTSGVMIMTDDIFTTLSYNREDLQKAINYSKDIKRLFEHTGSDYLRSKVPLTKAEQDELKKTKETNARIKSKIKKFKKLNKEQLFLEASSLVKEIRELLSDYEKENCKIMYSANSEKLSQDDFFDYKKNKQSKLSEVTMSDYIKKYNAKSIAIKKVLDTKIDKSKYSLLNKEVLDFENPTNIISLNNIVDEIEIMSKILVLKPNSKREEIQQKGQKLIDGINQIIENNIKKEEEIKGKFSNLSLENNPNVNYIEIVEKERLESSLLNIKYLSKYNLDYKIDALILRAEILKILPDDYKSEIDVLYYTNPNTGNIVRIKADLENMLKSLNKL
ncbi:MAG: hypothetical protein KDC90_15075 [Ignavibacteriae bacterium]|nr:hypothetical protein [Ignavibacteriota bacterium]